MKKRLIIWIIAVIVLSSYLFRRNRDIKLPERDENLFNLPEQTIIPREENLGYTLQRSGAKALFALIKDHDTINSFRPLGYRFSTFFKFKLLLELQKQLPETILQSKYAKETLGNEVKLFTGSIEDYFSGLNFLALQEKINELGTLEEIIDAIHSQGVYLDNYTDFPFYWTGAIIGSVGDQTFGQYLNMLALWYTHHGDYQKGFEALQASFLMGHKGYQNRSIIYTLIGSVVKSNALQTLHYLLENYELSIETLQNYLQLLTNNNADPTEIFSNTMKGEYHMIAAGIQHFEQFSKQELFDSIDFLNGKNPLEISFAFLMLKSKLFDVEETIKILNFYFAQILNRNDSVEHFFETSCLENNNQRFPHIFQRKNVAGIKFLCELLPRTKGNYDIILSVDAYQHFLKTLLEQKISR